MIKFQMDMDGFKREMRGAVQQQADQIFKESGRSLQREVDAVYHSRFGRTVDELKADLESRFRHLDFTVDANEMAEWAEAINRGERIEIEVKGKISF